MRQVSEEFAAPFDTVLSIIPRLIMPTHFSITHCHTDLRQASALQQTLKGFYPLASAALVPDGESYKDRLKATNGGQWIERVLRSFPTDCDRLFKIEPDVGIIRPCGPTPGNGWFGHVRHHQTLDRKIVFGGLWGMNRRSVADVLASEFLRDPKYLGEEWKYDRYGEWRLKGERKRPPIYCCDHIMADVMDRLGYAPVNWHGVHLTFRENGRTPIADLGQLAFFN